LNIVQSLFFMDVDKDVALDRFVNAGPFHFSRLEYYVSVGQNYRLAPGAQAVQDSQSQSISRLTSLPEAVRSNAGDCAAPNSKVVFACA